MIGLRYIAAAFGCAATLSLSTFARADVLADACLDYVNSSEMLKEVPTSNKSKWCGCIVDKITPGARQSVADVMKLQKTTEAKGQAFGEPSVPKPLANAFTLYFDAQGPCLPVMMGAAPGQTASAPPAAAPPAAAPLPPPRSAAARASGWRMRPVRRSANSMCRRRSQRPGVRIFLVTIPSRTERSGRSPSHKPRADACKTSKSSLTTIRKRSGKAWTFAISQRSR